MSTGMLGPLRRDSGLLLDVARLARLRNPQRQAALATVLLLQIAVLEQQVSAIRDAAVRRMREQGDSYGAIAAATGITRSRVVQILQRTTQGD